jgi:hypothetical protein
MKYELKDYLNSINHQKNNLLDEDDAIKGYPPYIINRCLSGMIDTIMYSNEMNRFHFLNKDIQYIFLLNSVRPKKRFSPWLKADKLQNLEIVKQYYGYSNEKAKTALGMLSEDQINYIKSKLNVGGKK